MTSLAYGVSACDTRGQGCGEMTERARERERERGREREEERKKERVEGRRDNDFSIVCSPLGSNK